MIKGILALSIGVSAALVSAVPSLAADPPITHQISLPSSQTWCDDSLINGLFDQINTFRLQNGVPALNMSTLGMQDAEMRASQFAIYMQTANPSAPGFNPHQGWDTTAASLGYNIVSEDLAYANTEPGYIVGAIWQDPLHLAALLSSSANVMGVSCVYMGGIPFWTYEPGICSGSSCGSSSTPPPNNPPPPTSPVPVPVPTGVPTLDSEDWNFLTLINNYRTQNGLGTLQVDVELSNAALWMSDDMSLNNYISHTDSLGRSTPARLAAFGYTASWGEDLAAGLSDAQSVFTGFQTACDPDGNGTCTFAHRQIMLGAGFTAIGIARAFNNNSNYGWYWAVDFGGVVEQAVPPPGSTPPSGSAPSIGAFTANPATITAGQASALSWTVTGATTLTINNGVGNVSAVTSINVFPTQTTTYLLTVSNSNGSATAQVTVTVNPTTPPPTSVPAITSFTASPTGITAGQSSTLSWRITGATTVTLNNGIGDVSTVTSKAVSPSQTTTYTLTATNSAGSTTAQTTITVSAPQLTGPTAPVLTSATQKNANEVDLAWTPSISSGGLSSYQIFQNGSILAIVTPSTLSYADMSVSPGGTYTYSVRAIDSSSFVSPMSNTILVTVSGAPTTTGSCSAPPTGAFVGCYYGNISLSGAPALVRTDSQINFDWGGNVPDRSIPRGSFSVLWEGNFTFAAGTYQFSIVASDGMRVYIDGNLILNQWQDQPPTMFNTTQQLSQGTHLIMVQYYDETGTASAHLTWQGSAPVVQLPSILSFTASPSSVTQGKTSILSWSVTGATSVSINNGVGAVSGTSATVQPGQTTTYTLTAANSAGSSTANVTVSVTTAPDTQPPSTPSLNSAMANSSSEVDLAWSSSTDNVGVAGYQILRNGSPLSTVSAGSLSFADTSVTAGASYTYTVKAYDAANNYSAPSNPISVTVPTAPPTGGGGGTTSCTTTAVSAFTGCYYPNITLSGAPTLVRTDPQINFDWNGNVPDRSLPRGGFSVRWQGIFSFAQGTHTFTAVTSDGMRLYIDGSLVLDHWVDQSATQYTVSQALSGGTHTIAVEYFEQTGAATAHVTWQ